ncbi:MAG: hypothetical protein ACRD2A_01045, partial [Vicinamibacterales bacterium]
MLRDPRLVRLAQEWTYILRSRTRWADDEDLRQSLRERALDDLENIGVPRTFLKKLTSTSHVEVELHKWDAADEEANRIHEAAAEIPWEYLISAATRGVGRYHPILITRLFRNQAPDVIPAPPQQVLFIESAPGRLKDTYEFELERDRIRAAVGADDRRASEDAVTSHATMDISETASLSQLKKTVRGAPWDVLHVTGIDTHQAAWYIETLYEELAEKPSIWKRIVDRDGRVRDGMILREPNVAELPVSYADLAAALINPKSPPKLVTLNLYYSGARTSRELVKQGAHAAMGFLDEIDDELAERFFQEFYWAWCRPGGAFAIPHAFVEAWHKMTGDRLHGTAIAIWTGRSVFEEFRLAPRGAPSAAQVAETRQAMIARLALTPVRELLQVDLDVPDEINYSLLHNDRALLNKLTLTRLVKDPLEDITVQVELNLGAQNYPYRYTHMVLDERMLDLTAMIRIPLTAALPRSLRERVQSTVYVKVACGGRTAREETRRVTLIPVDEWVDDTDNNP